MSEEVATGAEEITGTEDTGAGQGDVQTPSTSEPTGGERTFSQEDVDRIVQSRLAKVKKETESTIQSAITDHMETWKADKGLTDEVLEQLDKRPQHERDLRTMKAQVTKAENARAAAEQKAEKIRSHLLNSSGRDAVFKAASAESNDPESVFLHVQSRLEVDEDNFKVYVLDENGDIDASTTVSDLVSGVLAQKPHLAKPKGTGGSGSRPKIGGDGNGKSTHDLRTPAGRAAAFKERVGPLLTRE